MRLARGHWGTRLELQVVAGPQNVGPGEPWPMEGLFQGVDVFGAKTFLVLCENVGVTGEAAGGARGQEIRAGAWQESVGSPWRGQQAPRDLSAGPVATAMFPFSHQSLSPESPHPAAASVRQLQLQAISPGAAHGCKDAQLVPPDRP